MFKSLAVGLAVLAAILAGCTSVPERKIVTATMPRGEKLTIVAHDRKVPDWMYSDDALRVDFLVRGDVTEEQLKAVAAAENACRIYVDTAHPSRLVAVATNGLLYLGSGALGVGLGAKEFLNPRATVGSDYYGYGATAGAFNGLASGLVSSGGRSYSFQNCTANMMSAVFQTYQVRALMKSQF